MSIRVLRLTAPAAPTGTLVRAYSMTWYSNIYAHIAGYPAYDSYLDNGYYYPTQLTSTSGTFGSRVKSPIWFDNDPPDNVNYGAQSNSAYAPGAAGDYRFEVTGNFTYRSGGYWSWNGSTWTFIADTPHIHPDDVLRIVPVVGLNPTSKTEPQIITDWSGVISDLLTDPNGNDQYSAYPYLESATGYEFSTASGDSIPFSISHTATMVAGEVMTWRLVLHNLTTATDYEAFDRSDRRAFWVTDSVMSIYQL